jgi:F0F1-type ATP synthase assembly protein I
MSNPSKPATTPTSIQSGGPNTPSEPSNSSVASSAAIALGMSWQLLAVLVLPLWGGYLLDQHLGSSPLWMCVGMGVAVVASVLVVRQAMTQLREVMGNSQKETK